MLTTMTADGEPCLTEERGRWVVRVPRARAAYWHEALRRAGCPATLCLDPAAPDVRLELWPAVTPAAVRAELRRLRPAPSGTAAGKAGAR